MTRDSLDGGAGALTGRITSGPHPLVRSEILAPQLDGEVDRLLGHYLWIEKVLLLEYHRLGLLESGEVAGTRARLSTIDGSAVREAAAESMTDLAFAVERLVTTGLTPVPVRWHVDRSRNDLQATAQVMFGRDQVLDIVGDLVALTRAVLDVAETGVEVLMPGYTHSQAAQVISVGFYLSALSEQVLHSLDRFESVTRSTESAPIGAGAMAGGELDWDRDRMARLLGFRRGDGHALRAVATRDWTLETAAELCLLSVPLSRVATDLITWSGSGYGFIDLPDEWSGISSAMPQKKNLPVLERIRARTAHLASGFLDVVVAQRATPFSNTVEVSKEAGSLLPGTLATARSVFRLFTAVLTSLRFRTDRLHSACATEHLGGMALANRLCLEAGIPWRDAQITAGRYIVEATAPGRNPAESDAELLEKVAAGLGFTVPVGRSWLAAALDVNGALARKRTAGSTNPGAVRGMLDRQRVALARHEDRLRGARDRIRSAAAETDRQLDGIATTRR